MGGVGVALVLVAAGVVAGASGAAGGVTSLVSYPALLAVGVPALPANVANLVAGVACWPGSALTSRHELARTRRAWSRRGLPAAAAGTFAGSVLLINTSPGVFARLVPFLVAVGSLVLLAQPWLTALVARRSGSTGGLAWPLVGLVSIYGGYFGAGSGIMLLAVLLILLDDRLPEANAVKNMLLGVGALVSATVLGLVGPVDWAVVVPLAAGMFGGSAAGPVITRRVPPPVVRWVVGLLGLAFAVVLAVRGSGA
jgi:uncharacterized membrane protein YfcA